MCEIIDNEIANFIYAEHWPNRARAGQSNITFDQRKRRQDSLSSSLSLSLYMDRITYISMDMCTQHLIRKYTNSNHDKVSTRSSELGISVYWASTYFIRIKTFSNTYMRVRCSIDSNKKTFQRHAITFTNVTKAVEFFLHLFAKQNHIACIYWILPCYHVKMCQIR